MKKVKKTTIRRLQSVARVISGLGFLFMLGSVGACEVGNIGLGQFAVQAVIGLLAFAGGAYIGGLIE